ncbi:uncharacterized protein LOC109546888 isoform X1 [Dendroctonus ponderosae]|uniref:uncharacterized protein LOC109546888 isoform X1 n=1 Tax=Dendroctonus ponderosae TaxID=77166 RepID=UPI0020356733|nr:uncharacterized protein LOC109546888 isoform X1 [Dendroctonus ponderosae]
MALLKIVLLPAVLCALLVKSDTDGQVSDRGAQTYPLISAVLDHLNANPNKVFDYDRGSLLSAENKGSVIEVSVEVEVSCNNNYPGIPCNEHALICNAFLGPHALNSSAYMVLSDVRCSPTMENTMEEADESIASTREAIGDQKLDLSNEALNPRQESADFVAVRTNDNLCGGCPYDLHTDAEGVDELVDNALKHIESERSQRYRITKIRRLQQQVVAGIKYILLADVAQTTCSKDADVSALCALDESIDPIVCKVSFIEQPWISKNKHIIENNCTLSQEFECFNHSSNRKNDESNEIIPHKDLDISKPDVVQKPTAGHNFDAIAQTGNMEALIDPEHLADIESQILLDVGIKENRPKSYATPQDQTVYSKVDEPLSTSTDLQSLKVEPLRTLYESLPIDEEQEQDAYATIPQIDFLSPTKAIESIPNPNWYWLEKTDHQFKRNAKDDSSFEESNESKSDSSEEKKQPTESSTLKQLDEGVTVKTRRNVDDTSESLSHSKDSSEESNRPKRTTTDSSESDSDSKDSSEGAARKAEATEAKDRVQRDANRDSTGESASSSTESKEKIGPTRQRRSIGQLEKILPEEKIIVRGLADFAATSMDYIDDDHHKRVILQILGAKKLKLDGIYYQIILRLGISQCNENEHNDNCKDKLFTNLTKICKVQVHVDDDYSNPKVVKSQCQNIKKDENDRNRTNYSRYRRQIVGAPADVPADDPEVKAIIKKTLDKLDAASDHPNKRKTTEIVSVTSQVVAGIRYVVTAKIGLTSCKKTENKLGDTCDLLNGTVPETCTIDFTEQPWVKKTYFVVTCNDKVYNFGNHDRVRRNCPGCPSDLDPSEIDHYLTKGLSHLDSSSTSNNRYISEKILRSTKQLVAGWFVTIKAQITESNCPKSNTEAKDCTKLQGSKSKVCSFRIWEQPWINFTQIGVTCDNEDTQVFRSRRAISDEHFESPAERVHGKSTHADALKNGFLQFMNKYNKQYKHRIEFNFRLKVFRDNLNRIDLLNKYERGTARYGITQFADLTEAEFSKLHGYRPELRNENELPFARANIPDIELPTDFDWRAKGAVTEVKNQGLCGSCWAFSVTGNIEGQYALKHGALLEFSEQELVDCDKEDQGCNGGLMDTAYRVIEKMGGLESESDYPYEGADETCIFNKGKVKVQVTGALNISQNETDMAKWLVQNGPISIAINANAMQFYFGGISHPWASLCSPNSLDHGVLIVGYGVHSYALFNRTIPYWIVKNSWGPSWGEQGYYRVFRGDGTCGLNQTPSSAIVA